MRKMILENVLVVTGGVGKLRVYRDSDESGAWIVAEVQIKGKPFVAGVPVAMGPEGDVDEAMKQASISAFDRAGISGIAPEGRLPLYLGTGYGGTPT